jgi:gluconolactonase
MEHVYDDPGREMKFTGVFKITSEGNVVLLTDKMTAPNGIGLSPDESKLYVSNSDNPALWMEYNIQKDGSLYPAKIFYQLSDTEKKESGAPYGLKVRADGILFATGPGGVWIFSPDGKHLGTIKTGQATSNCSFDEEGKYLYMTADNYLMRIRLKGSLF